MPTRPRRDGERECAREPGSSPFSEKDWLLLAKTLDLSARQVEVAKLLCEGFTYGGMAARLNISVNTVRMHMRALFAKLGTRDQVGVVVRLVVTQRRLARPQS